MKGKSILSFLFLSVLIAGDISVYLLVEDELVKKVSLAVLVLVLFIILTIFYKNKIHLPLSLKRKLIRAESFLQQENTETIKEFYLKIYHLYLKLSEKQKLKFYSQINQLRENIEKILQAEKKVKEGLAKIESKTNFSELKEIYQKINESYQQLPELIKQTYYSQLTALKSKLERGM
ncbi:MAG TPA: hypothetical protein VJA23_04200 [Candidatus Nanoarchaeia archaeon]|nr:hypothetical protein [Candidatus Nanoarchaeia archaeon]